MTDTEAYESGILLQYSQGEIGWRQACAALGVMTISELHQLLSDRGYHLPPEDASPLSNDDAERLRQFLNAGGYDADA